METAESRRILSRGVPLHVEVRGTGPPVLLGHGMFCTGRMFDELAPRLAPAYRLVVPDFPGHGRSPAPDGPMTLDGLAADYRSVMDALGIDRAAVVGFSMGGMAALRLAAAHPARVAGLALVNTTAGAQSFHERQVMKGLGALTARLGHRPAAVRSAARLMFSDAYRAARPDVVEAWCAHLAGLPPEVAAEITRMIADRDTFVGRLAGIAAPAVVVGSTRDAATPPRHARTLARHLPGARLHLLDAGHATPLECPGPLAEILAGFLATLRRGPTPPGGPQSADSLSRWAGCS